MGKVVTPPRRFVHPPRTGGRSIAFAWELGEPEYQKHAPPSAAEFIYGVARNPWDRVVSIWFLMRDAAPNFKKWVCAGFEPTVHISGFQVYRPCSWWLHPLQAGVWRHRADIVAERGLRDADFVVRFEHWEEDLTKLSELLGRPFPARHVGKSARGPYQDYYDDETRQIVAEAFAEDIQIYGYAFA